MSIRKEQEEILKYKELLEKTKRVIDREVVAKLSQITPHSSFSATFFAVIGGKHLKLIDKIDGSYKWVKDERIPVSIQLARTVRKECIVYKAEANKKPRNKKNNKLEEVKSQEVVVSKKTENDYSLETALVEIDDVKSELGQCYLKFSQSDVNRLEALKASKGWESKYWNALKESDKWEERTRSLSTKLAKQSLNIEELKGRSTIVITTWFWGMFKTTRTTKNG